MYVELLVGNESGTKVYQPVVQEGIEWSTERKNTPGKLVFKVLYDNILDFSEGSPVRMKVDGDNVFFGFVFKQQRTKDKIITVTAYDQLRYLKNKDTKVYEGKTANQFVKMIADDYALNLGTLDDTGYVIESRVEENTSLFEMIANALDLTLTNTGEMYVLYDDFGKLTLKSLSSMYVGVPGAYLMIDEETGQNFDYTSFLMIHRLLTLLLICYAVLPMQNRFQDLHRTQPVPISENLLKNVVLVGNRVLFRRHPLHRCLC